MSAAEKSQRAYLVVDDAKISRRMLARMLETIGPCEVHQASDRAEAIDELAEACGRIDVVLSDYRMPNVNGLELLKRIRMGETAAPADTPFALTTSYDDQDVVALAVSLDADAFLPKPITKSGLAAQLDRIAGNAANGAVAVQAADVYAAVDPNAPLARALE